MPDAKSTVTAHFAEPLDPPLVRKFGVMNSGLVAFERHQRDLHLLSALAPDSLRIDLCWGEPRTGWSQEPVQGTADHPVYHLTEMDELAQRLNDLNVLPYWSYCYTPPPLQHPDWQSVPSDLNAWGKVLHDMARHFRTAGLTIGYHEVYNEPDLPGVFFTGTLDDYLQMYASGARGLKAGDPHALVGGPALADTDTWTAPFLDFVDQHDLPLDFFSFHVLNPGWPEGTLHHAARRLAQLREDFAGRERFFTTEVHINEYHPYTYANTGRGGAADRHPLAARIFSDIQGLLQETDLTLVHWAQFMSSLPGVSDEGMGLVDLDGRRKAAYHAFSLYARMPIDRRAVLVEGGLQAMASVDDRRASLVIWNDTAQHRTLEAHLTELPFAQAELQVFRIDHDHASSGDDPRNEALVAAEPSTVVEAADARWTGVIPAGGVVYLELNDVHAVGYVGRPPARAVHVRRFYPNRGASSYADFDRRTWTARLGMGREASARELIAVEAADLPAELHMSFEVSGAPGARRADSVLGVRVDYRDHAGGAVSSVLFCDDPGAPQEVMPWGTRRAADRTERVDLAAFTLPLASFAPRGWADRATLTFLMQDVGQDARVKVTVRLPPHP